MSCESNNRWYRLCRISIVVGFIIGSLSVTAETIDDKTMRDILAFGESVGVPQSVTKQLIYEESRGNTRAVSRRTEEGFKSHGLCQLYDKPSNLWKLIDEYWIRYHEIERFDIYNPYHNSRVALRYLANLHKRFGNWVYALYFYNCGRVYRVPESTQEYAYRIVNAR